MAHPPTGSDSTSRAFSRATASTSEYCSMCDGISPIAVTTPIFGRASERRYFISPGLSAPNSSTKTCGYFFLRGTMATAIMVNNARAQKNAFCNRLVPAGVSRLISFRSSSLHSPMIFNGVPISLLKFPLDRRTRQRSFSLKPDIPFFESTAKMASFADVFPTLPVIAITSGRYTRMIMRAPIFIMFFNMLTMVSTRRLWLVRCYIIVVQYELCEFTECRDDRLAGKRSSLWALELDQNHEFRVVRRCKTLIGIDHIIAVPPSPEVRHICRTRLSGYLIILYLCQLIDIYSTYHHFRNLPRRIGGNNPSHFLRLFIGRNDRLHQHAVVCH